MSIAKAIAFAALGKKTFPYEIAYTENSIAFSRKNSAFSLVKGSFLLDDTFEEALKSATVVDYEARTNRDIFIFSLMKDSLVSPLNAKNFTSLASLNPLVKSYFFDNSQYLIC